MYRSQFTRMVAIYGSDTGLSLEEQKDLIALGVSLLFPDIFLAWLDCTFPVLGEFLHEKGINVKFDIRAGQRNGIIIHEAPPGKPDEPFQTFTFVRDGSNEFYPAALDKASSSEGHFISLLTCVLVAAQQCREGCVSFVSLLYEFNLYTRDWTKRPKLAKDVTMIFEKANIKKVQFAFNRRELRICTAYRAAYSDKSDKDISTTQQLARFRNAKVPIFLMASTVPDPPGGENTPLFCDKIFQPDPRGKAARGLKQYLTVIVRTFDQDFKTSGIRGQIVDFGGNPVDIAKCMSQIKLPE